MPVSSGDAARLVGSLLGEGAWACQLFGEGKFSQTFAVSEDHGRQFVLRIAPSDSVLQLFYEYRMMRQEPGIHKRLLNETSVPVTPIVAYDFFRGLTDRDFLIMPRLPGSPLNRMTLDAHVGERAFREWGQYMAQIHTITDPCNRFGYLGEHGCMKPQSSWQNAFQMMYQKELEDICSSGVYSKRQTADAMALLEDHSGAFNTCTLLTLCHGDSWGTNLLVQPDGEVTGVIDFDRACWEDIEWDMAIAEYCGITRPPFWDGYGRMVNTHSGDAAIRRLFYLLHEHQKYIIISMSSRRNDPGRAQQYARECVAIMDRFKKTGQPQF